MAMSNLKKYNKFFLTKLLFRATIKFKVVPELFSEHFHDTKKPY